MSKFNWSYLPLIPEDVLTLQRVMNGLNDLRLASLLSTQRRKYMSNNFTEWRSKTKCRALELTETTQLPIENPVPNTEDSAVPVSLFKHFQPGDYEVHQDGRVFGRTKADHEAAFERTVKRQAKAIPPAGKRARAAKAESGQTPSS
jgi:hypothetical protein